MCLWRQRTAVRRPAADHDRRAVPQQIAADFEILGAASLQPRELRIYGDATALDAFNHVVRYRSVGGLDQQAARTVRPEMRTYDRKPVSTAPSGDDAASRRKSRVAVKRHLPGTLKGLSDAMREVPFHDLPAFRFVYIAVGLDGERGRLDDIAVRRKHLAGITRGNHKFAAVRQDADLAPLNLGYNCVEAGDVHAVVALVFEIAAVKRRPDVVSPRI